MEAYVALLITLVKPLIAVGLPFTLLPLLIVLERRGAAYIQDRPGPNRAAINLSVRNVLGALMFKQEAIAAIFSRETGTAGTLRLRGFGLIFNATDGIKGFFKQAFTPAFVHRWYYIAAPMLPVACGIMATAILPWFAPLTFQTPTGVATVSGQALDADAGLLVLFAIGSLGVYGIVLGSWASNSKFSLLGGMRASAMMVSYEVSMGLAALSVILLVGTFNLTQVVEWQVQNTWAVFAQPLAFLLFLTAIFAECNRTPFDVIEGESEIVAGFHTEYGSGKFLAFMSGEYLHVVVSSALIAILFLGGWSVLPFPVPNGESLKTGLSFLISLNFVDMIQEFGKGRWITLDTGWMREHLGLVGAGVCLLAGLGALGFAVLVNRRRVFWAGRVTSDRTLRVREYGFYALVGLLACLAFLAGAVACLALGDPAALQGVTERGAPVYPLWMVLAVGVVQMLVVLGKTLFMCWFFVWVRWTLPRFRYDQIMSLGWKVMLNLALANLLITAVVMKLIGGAHG